MSRKKKDKKEVIHCCDCENSYDYHELNYKGEPFLCRCPFFEWSRFLHIDTCIHVKPKRK